MPTARQLSIVMVSQRDFAEAYQQGHSLGQKVAQVFIK